MIDDNSPLLEQHADQLVDRWKIVEVLNSYAFHFDRNEPVAVGELFEEDAVIDYGPEMGPIHGRKSLIQAITAGLNQIFAATSHHISNVTVQFSDSSTARAIAYVYAWHRYHDGSPDGYLWGQYHTRLRDSGLGWKFTHMTLKAAGTVDFHRTAMHPIGQDRNAGSDTGI